jgi:hypothetical protein
MLVGSSVFRAAVVFGTFAVAGCTAKNTDSAGSAVLDAGASDVDIAEASDAPANGGPRPIPLIGCGVNYTAPVVLGDGSQTFQLIVDTGSSVLGVAGATCATCADAGVAPLYTPSATSSDTQKPASEKFANGEGWSGEIYEDTVTLGDASPVRVKFVDIESQSGFFSDVWCGVRSNEGILGLGPSNLLLGGTTSYLDQLKQAGSADVFSFQLCGTSGTLWLGGLDAQYAPTYTPMVAGQRFYTVVVSSIDVGGTSLGLPASDYGNAFVDTGGDALWLPQPAFDAATVAIGSDENFKTMFGSASSFFSTSSGCKSIKETSAELDAMLPRLSLTFGSGIVVDAPATSSYLMEFAGCGYKAALFTRGAATQGLPGIELGASFLRDKITVIDRAQQRIGFAKGSCP